MILRLVRQNKIGGGLHTFLDGEGGCPRAEGIIKELRTRIGKD